MNEFQSHPGLRTKHNQAASIVAEMTLEEKTAFCSGRNFWELEVCDRLGLPPVMITDGPHGLRKQAGDADHVGLNNSIPATCFPTACALASSWDTELMHEVGVALGEQCVAENVTVLLGPGLNIKRHPLCGRNFEYFSEDPLLSGELAAALVQGVQSRGVGTSIKHFAVNNQEDGRMFVDAVVDERTLREIYLRGFEIATKKAQPWTVMCAYNRVNGTYCSEHDWLLNQVLRDDWGFEGLVVTDWGATNDRVAGMLAGLDLEMPASGGVNDRRVLEAVRSGTLSEAVLDASIIRNVSLVLLGADLAGRETNIDQSRHHSLARRVAAESSVLLKNEGNLLPLSQSGEIAIIGAFAKESRYQGTGSSQVTPTHLEPAFDAIRSMVPDSCTLTYARGYDAAPNEVSSELLAEAVAAAEKADAVILFAGLPAVFESEGFDRSHMHMPEQHNLLIEAVCTANPRCVVVLANGAPVTMPWISLPGAVLESYLPGQSGGRAVAELLFGFNNPSGKLAETFPLAQSDVPSDQWFPGNGRQVQYREGLYVGYRYFNSCDKAVLFPFGHGLSYTQFEYANLRVSTASYKQGGELLVSFDVKNAGDRKGAEVAQLYVRCVQSRVYRPVHELKSFAKTTIEPGETSTLTLRLDDSAFAVYGPDAGKWLVEAGQYEIQIGASSRDIRLTANLLVESDQSISDQQTNRSGPSALQDPFDVPDEVFASMIDRPIPEPEPSRPFHINSSLNEISETWLGGIIKSRVVAGLRKNLGDTDADPTHQKMFDEIANNMPLRALALFGAGLSFQSLNILLALLNKNYLRAIRLAVKPEPVTGW